VFSFVPPSSISTGSIASMELVLASASSILVTDTHRSHTKPPTLPAYWAPTLLPRNISASPRFQKSTTSATIATAPCSSPRRAHTSKSPLMSVDPTGEVRIGFALVGDQPSSTSHHRPQVVPTDNFF
jgi:hypothetical protein